MWGGSFDFIDCFGEIAHKAISFWFVGWCFVVFGLNGLLINFITFIGYNANDFKFELFCNMIIFLDYLHLIQILQDEFNSSILFRNNIYNITNTLQIQSCNTLIFLQHKVTGQQHQNHIGWTVNILIDNCSH